MPVCKPVAKGQLAGDKVQKARGVARAKHGPNELAKLLGGKNGQETTKNEGEIETARLNRAGIRGREALLVLARRSPQLTAHPTHL